IKEAFPDVRLVVVGAFSDEEKASFVRYARAHHLSGIHFVGWVSRDDLPRYYKSSAVYCAPSTGFESFGIVLLEAMASGLPIVASDIAGYREVLHDGVQGRLVPPEDAVAIAEAIITILKNPLLGRQMAERGRTTAAQYDWSLIANRVLEYYGELKAIGVKKKSPSFRSRAMRRLSEAMGDEPPRVVSPGSE
ncbi:MAG: glycosyltransferase, partial [Rudaea sp.]